MVANRIDLWLHGRNKAGMPIAGLWQGQTCLVVLSLVLPTIRGGRTNYPVLTRSHGIVSHYQILNRRQADNGILST